MLKHITKIVIMIAVLVSLDGCFSNDDTTQGSDSVSEQASASAAQLAESNANTVLMTDKSKGIDRDVIVSLTPKPAEQNVDASTRIEVVFSIPLDPSSVQKNNIKLTHLSSQSNDHVKGVINYNEETKTVTYTPDEPLKPGVYEVEIKSLKPTKAYKEIHINEIKYQFLVGGELEEADPTPTVTLLSSESNQTIVYNHITLEVNTTHTVSLSAVNQTLIAEQNRTIKIKGVDNNGTYFLYNLPLLQGSNEINITATSDKNVSLSTLISLTSDANGSAPIGMRAGSYTGIGSLQTTVEVGTLLNVGEYLFDSNGDGVIDAIHAANDSNFTVNYNQEGRYKPRVTIRTTDNLLYSSEDFALSLDVIADENQYDPTGAQPIDIAKTYVQAIIDNDRETVERLLGNNEKMIGYVYGNPKARQFLAETYGKITSWEQTYHDSGRASIKILMNVNGEVYGGGFEMNVASMQINTGRTWVVRFFY